MTLEQQPLANRYSLIRQLAAGSYAETWLGNDGSLDRYVAVKLLHPTESNPDEDTQEFLHEARIAASVSHPNIVAVFDAGEEEGRPFLIMEWVDGDSLKQEIVSSRRITPERALDVSSELLDGLSAIHAQGIIHRDIKPQNIMVNGFGTIKLTDFGIARLITESESRADGTTAGSAAYMAPEQAQGLAITPAADIYAAGVILYEMLTGRLPFRSDDPQEVLLQHINDPVPRPRRTNPSIPAQVEAIVLKALEKNPEDRFTSAEEMRDALLAARNQLPVRRPVTLPVNTESGFGTPWQRLAWMAASIALIVVAIAGATSLAALDFGTSQTSAGSEEQSIVSEDTASTPEATPEPVVTSEPTITQQTQSGPPDPPHSIYENDEYRVRGEVVVEGPSVPEGSVNRPAPSRPATDDDLADEGNDRQTTAQVQQPAPPPPPTPTPPPPPPPTPTPVPVVEPTATPEPVEEEPQDPENPDDSEPSDPDDSGENPGQGSGSGNGDQNSNSGNGNNGGNGQGRNGDDDDVPASNQEQVDDDESADPQSSDDDDSVTEPDETDNMVASEDSTSDDAAVDDDDDVADLSDSEATTDDDDASADDEDDASADENASVDEEDNDSNNSSRTTSSNDDEAATGEDDATENDDSDAELLDADAADDDVRNSDDEKDEKSRDRDRDKTDKDKDEAKDKKKDNEKKKTQDQPRTERTFERFINRFSTDKAA